MDTKVKKAALPVRDERVALAPHVHGQHLQLPGLMSWLDRMEERLGLRHVEVVVGMVQHDDPDLAPEEWEAVLGFSGEAVALLDTMRQTMPEIFNDPEVAEAARRVQEDHDRIVELHQQEQGQ